MTNQTIIIGIGGISRSGKSFLAKELSGLITSSGKSVNILDQDDFVFPESQIPTIRDHIDWECPESIDVIKFKKAVIQSKNNYDITIVEGLMIFWNPEIFRFLDISIFIELSRDEFFKRKQQDLRWGKEPDWYIQHIWDGYQKYGQYPKDRVPNLILDGTEMFDIEEISQNLIPQLPNSLTP